MDSPKAKRLRFADSGWHRIVTGLMCIAFGTYETISGPMIPGTYPPFVDWLTIAAGIPLVVAGLIELYPRSSAPSGRE